MIDAKALAADLVDAIEADLEKLVRIGDVIHVSDVYDVSDDSDVSDVG
jgi:hypothetical protein